MQNVPAYTYKYGNVDEIKNIGFLKCYNFHSANGNVMFYDVLIL